MKALICTLLIGMVFWGCKKNTDTTTYQNQGVITGYDLRQCASPYCGGLFVTIKNDTTKNAPPYYLIGSPLPGLQIDQSTKFPINVSLDWKLDTSIPGVNYHMIVTKVRVDP